MTDLDFTVERKPMRKRETNSLKLMITAALTALVGCNDIVNYNGTLYKSLMDGNTWSPDSYPQGWTEVAEG